MTFFEFDPADAETDFAAEMTNRQFAALRVRLNKPMLIVELKALPVIAKLKCATNYDEREVRKYLANGWNTEFLLRTTAKLFAPDQLINAVHWAFPQAYYSAFTVTLAFFKAVGHSEHSHGAVIRKFGELVEAGKYPERLRFTARGGKPIHFVGITKTKTPSTLTFDPKDAALVETQICQFLKATRERDLNERKKSAAFKTKSGKKKKSLASEEWRVSDALGPTSLLSLLYRKRIKSNYQEIETLVSPQIEAKPLFDDLIHVVSCLNLVNEVFVGKACGIEVLERASAAIRDEPFEFQATRLQYVREITGSV